MPIDRSYNTINPQLNMHNRNLVMFDNRGFKTGEGLEKIDLDYKTCVDPNGGFTCTDKSRTFRSYQHQNN